MKPGLRSCFCLSALCGLLAGCAGMTSAPGTSPALSSAVKVNGSVHGGQQPVSGASVQLYAVGATADGSAPTPLLTPAVPSGPDGSFSLQGLFTCPAGDPLVYITATGGNPGLSSGTHNDGIGLMAALGHCSTLGTGTVVQINEVTTVAAVAALGPFMSAPLNVGASPTDETGLEQAFSTAAILADYTTGTAPGAGYSGSPSSSSPSVPVTEMYSLANVLAACINSPGGVSTDPSTPCGKLYSLTGNAGDVLSALVALEKSPAAYDTASIFQIGSAVGPFQPTLSTPPDTFAVAVLPAVQSNAVYDWVPKTVYPGGTLYVFSATSNCLPSLGQQMYFNYFAQSNIFLDLGRFYNDGSSIGESGCGRIGGLLPTGKNLPYSVIPASTLVLQNSQYSFGLPFSLTVIPPPDQGLTFDKTTLFSNGGITTAQFSETTHLRNNTSSTVTLTPPQLAGKSAAAFTIDSSNCNVPLPPGTYCTIMEHYDPRVLNGGLIQASLVVSDTTNTLHATAVVAGIGYPDE